MNEHIRRDHEELLESLGGGKLPRNLSWIAVVELIGQIGEVQPRVPVGEPKVGAGVMMGHGFFLCF